MRSIAARVERARRRAARAPPASRSPRRCPAASARRCRACARPRSTTWTASDSDAPLTRRRTISTSRCGRRVVDPVVQAAALDRVVQVARAVGGQHDHRRVRRADRAELGDRHRGLGRAARAGTPRSRRRRGRSRRSAAPPAAGPGCSSARSSGRADQVVGPEQVVLGELRAAARRPAGCSAAGAGSSTRTAPRPRRSRRSTAGGSAACRAPRRAPCRPRSCRRPPRPPAAAAAAGAGSGTSTWPGPRRRGSRRRRGAARASRRRARGSSAARRDHCGGSGRPCIAAHTRAGVHGMSMWSTPWVSYSASMTALTIAGGEPTFGRLADALGAQRVVRARRDGLAELEVRALERGRDQVVHERRS